MKPVVKAINSIRSKALNHRRFRQFLLDIQAEYLSNRSQQAVELAHYNNNNNNNFI